MCIVIDRLSGAVIQKTYFANKDQHMIILKIHLRIEHYTNKNIYKKRSIPIVGMVVTISPSLSLYNMVVLPAASRPTIRILISFLAKSRLKSLVKDSPIISFYLLHP